MPTEGIDSVTVTVLLSESELAIFDLPSHAVRCIGLGGQEPRSNWTHTDSYHFRANPQKRSGGWGGIEPPTRGFSMLVACVPADS